MQCVFNAGLLLFHFHLGAGTDLDHRNTASQLGHALLQLLFVVVRGRVFDLTTDLANAGFDDLGVTGTVDDGGVLFGQNHALGVTQVFQSRAFQAQAHFFGDHSAASQNGDVFQHGFATVTKAWRLGSSHFDDAAHVVDDQSRQRFTFHVFCNHQQRTAGLGNSFQHRQHFADVGDLLVHQQDERVFELGAHVVLVVDEVRGQVTAVELHAFHDVQFVVETRAFFNCDDAFFADFFHRFSNDRADLLVRVGGDSAYLSDRFGIGTGNGQLAHFFNHGFYGLVDAALQIHRVHARSN